VTLRRLVGWTGEVLLTAGVLLLLFAAWQLWWTDVSADRAQGQAVARLEQEFTAPTPDAVPAVPAELTRGDAFAIVRIPRFGADYARPVLEGTSRAILRDGVGHYVGTAGPGEVGNFALAGHRTTYGRPFHDIDRLAVGDRVVVETSTAFTVYAVSRSEVVRPGDVGVIAPVPSDPGAAPEEAVLTMTSCHPKYSATERFVVHADLVETVPRADWDPAALTAPAGSG
jgi:sortase A